MHKLGGKQAHRITHCCCVHGPETSAAFSASEMTDIVSEGALNSAHSLTS